jgi:chromate transporter
VSLPGGIARPTFRGALRFWALLGVINFGGPTGQIAIMHDELVDRRRWIDEDRFLHALSFCMLLPGPEAQQLAIYVGWLLHGFAGGIVAGVLFVLPAAVVMLGLAWTYAAHGQLPLVAGVFDGLSAAVVGIVFAATLTIASRALKGRLAAGVAAAAFVAIFLVGLPFPVVVLAAALAGLWLAPAAPTSEGVADDEAPRPSWRRAALVLVTGLAVWWVPLLAVALVTGRSSVYTSEGSFFSQVAVVTFGGAYAVLQYVGREVVARFGLSGADVVAGLGLAETTPGPLILVLEFLGFLAAYRNPGSLPPAVAGLLGAAVTVWATFVPCFLWIFLGAPWIERLRQNRPLRGALSGITAAVVGIIASLSLTVATVVLFGERTFVQPFRVAIPVPRLGSLDVAHALIATAAFVAIRRFKVHVVWVVVASAAAGLATAALR